MINTEWAENRDWDIDFYVADRLIKLHAYVTGYLYKSFQSNFCVEEQTSPYK